MIEFNQIEEEYEELEREDEWEETFRFNYSIADDLTLDNAKHPSNEKYNRYRNILPYDHSRIKLKECLQTDYINANLVENKYINRKYILAQGPLRNTCEHFWQMVWEQNTTGIVMLNRLTEKGMSKCEMYYPNLDEDNYEMTLTFGKFRLNYISEQPGVDYSIRVIECENLEQKETRLIHHLHFSNWPDFGEPRHTTSFLKFLNECKQRDIFNPEKSGPPVVHCSAGVGRSGTFILVDSMLEMIRLNDNKSPCSISQLLDEFRTYRMGLVQTHTQYKFAFKAIIDGVKQQSLDNMVDHEDIQLVENTHEHSESDSDDSDEDDSDDDEFYEKSEESKSTTRQRPGTAMKTNVKKFKTSRKSTNRIKELRSMQQKNRLISRDDDTEAESSNGFETAKPGDLRLNLDFLKDDKPNKKNKYEPVDVNDDSDTDYENDETPFATSRDIQTVKVNEPRKPLTQTLEEQAKSSGATTSREAKESPTENGHIYQRNVVVDSESSNTNLTSPIDSGSKKKVVNISEKEKRIAEKVKEIKEKQQKHEQYQKLMQQVRPVLIGGGLLIGGLLIFEICKKNFFH